MIDTSLAGEQLSSTNWDVAVLGAGPGGTIAAREAARRGLRTILIEARAFPRAKVCGGCLNPRAIQVLTSVGLSALVTQLAGVPIHGLTLKSGSLSAQVSLRPGLSVTRNHLDAALLQAAANARVTVVTETSATVNPEVTPTHRQLTLRHQDRTVQIQSRVVVCADGLLRSSLRLLPEMGPNPVHSSRMGAGIVLNPEPGQLLDSSVIPRDQITMVVGTGGYVGLAWAESNQLSVAAAVDAEAVRTAGSPSLIVHQILRASGIEMPAAESGWQGTPLLTTAPKWNAAERLFVIGDAAGYVEPFTGEGMSAALEQALAVLPLVEAAVQKWHPRMSSDWQRLHRQQFQKRLRICRFTAFFLRRSWMTQTVIRCLRVCPSIATGFIRSISRPTVSLPRHIETP